MIKSLSNEVGLIGLLYRGELGSEVRSSEYGPGAGLHVAEV